MSLDKANIFKLKIEEFEKYKQEPFLDCFESTKIFAKALKNDIDTKETPHSLLLSAEYGMGKTFFSTRFTQYLKKCKYEVIYFSAWENDYMQNPFLAFSKAIISYAYNRFTEEKYVKKLSNLFEAAEKIVSAMSLTSRIGIPGVAEMDVTIDAGRLLESFKENCDPIIDFRSKLSSFISKIPKKKLIVIVDELDRCRPDYAMKTLECIKHFFDIEGLFIILPTNKNALNNCIKALYGIENGNLNGKENYFQKFFNDERVLQSPTEEDYLYVVKQYICEDKLKEALDKHLLSGVAADYNSIQNLQICFAKYAYKAKLTVREVKDFSLELVRICNNFFEPIRTEWLACIFANKNKERGAHFQYPVNSEHCFYCEQYKNLENSSNGKQVLLDLSLCNSKLREITLLREWDFGNYDTYQKYINLINKIKSPQKKFKTYTDVYNFLEYLIADITALATLVSNNRELENHLNKIKSVLEEHKNAILKYQRKYGSDDDDINRRQKYIDVVNNPELIYFNV